MSSSQHSATPPSGVRSALLSVVIVVLATAYVYLASSAGYVAGGD